MARTEAGENHDHGVRTGAHQSEASDPFPFAILPALAMRVGILPAIGGRPSIRKRTAHSSDAEGLQYIENPFERPLAGDVSTGLVNKLGDLGLRVGGTADHSNKGAVEHADIVVAVANRQYLRGRHTEMLGQLANGKPLGERNGTDIDLTRVPENLQVSPEVKLILQQLGRRLRAILRLESDAEPVPSFHNRLHPEEPPQGEAPSRASGPLGGNHDA